MITNLLGILGGLCFAYCGVPAAYATYKAGKSIGTPITVALLITIGTVLMYAYLTASYGFDPILTFNYFVEFVSWAIVSYYHYFPRTNTSLDIARAQLELIQAEKDAKLEVTLEEYINSFRRKS